MVSIIVPVYNVEDYLDRCLESIVNQTFKDIEIILINDGSTDDSESICLKWRDRDKRIKYIKKENEGQGIARNLGVDKSKGQYLMFVDSDDWLEKNSLELMYDAEKKSCADIVVSDINNIYKDKDGILFKKVSALRIESNVIVDVKKDIRLIDTARLFFWGKLYTRDFYLKSNISQPAHAFEDTATLPLLIAKADTIYRVPKPLYNYFRVRKESTVNNVSRYGDILKSLHEIEDGFKKNNIFERYYKILRKISYSQVRFIYKRLLDDNNQIPLIYRDIIKSLYLFMDETYKDWVNLSNFRIGVCGSVNLKKAVKNIVFDDYKIHDINIGDNKNLLSMDMLIIDLVDDMFYKDVDKWKENCKRRLKILKDNFIKKQIILTKFVENTNYYKENEGIINYVYAAYKNSKLDICVIEVKGDRTMINENLQWDLSDEILNKIHKQDLSRYKEK